MPYKDKEKQKISSKKHYEANKKKIVDRAVINKKKVREKAAAYINEYLQSHHCVDCGESDAIVLEFDHVGDDKIANVSDMVNRLSYSLNKIKQEIEKCQVRCCNCHRRITNKRRLEKLKTQKNTTGI